jgi:hypothetical protein
MCCASATLTAPSQQVYMVVLQVTACAHAQAMMLTCVLCWAAPAGLDKQLQDKSVQDTGLALPYDCVLQRPDRAQHSPLWWPYEHTGLSKRPMLASSSCHGATLALQWQLAASRRARHVPREGLGYTYTGSCVEAEQLVPRLKPSSTCGLESCVVSTADGSAGPALQGAVVAASMDGMRWPAACAGFHCLYVQDTLALLVEQ